MSHMPDKERLKFQRVAAENVENSCSKSEETGRRHDEERICCLQRFSGAFISSLETPFYRLGLTVALNPKKTIAISVIIPLLCGIGLIKFHREEDLGTLLLPTGSRFIQDRHWIQANINSEERTINMLVQNDNVLTRKTLLAMMDIVDQVSRAHEGGLHYADVCLKVRDRCVINSLLDLWRYNRTVIETLTQDQILRAVRTTAVNPTYFTPMNTTRMLGGITKDTNNSINVAVVTAMLWHLTADPDNKEAVFDLERKVIDIAREGHKNLTGLYVYTEDLFDKELFQSIYDDLILLVFSVLLIIAYLIFTFGKPTFIEHGFPLMMAAMGGVILSSIACYGICLGVGLTFGVTHQGLYFLLVAIGVDDVFIINEAMKRVKRRAPSEPLHVQVAMAMKSAGASITVTSLSDIVAFASGISTRIPILRSFCVYSSVGVLALYIIQSTFFPACMVLNERRIRQRRDALVMCCKHKEYKPNKWKDVEILETFFTKYHGPFITSAPVKVLVILITLGLGGVMTWSLTHLQKGYNPQATVPPNALSRRYLDINKKYFHDIGMGVTVYCADVDIHDNLYQLETMLQKYRQSDANSYSEVVSWIPAFKMWLLKTNQSEMVLRNARGKHQDSFYRLLHRFTNESYLGALFANYIHFYDSSETSKVKLTEFHFMLEFEEENIANEMNVKNIREIADSVNTTTGMCFAYSKFFLFAGILEYVDVEMLRNFILAGTSVFIVTMVLIVHPLTSFYVLICVVLTTMALGGMMQFLDFMMAGNTVILLTFCIGLAVDFSAHVGHTFMTIHGTKDERVRETVSRIGPAVFHGGVSTFLGISGLVFAKSYSLSLFFYTFVTVVVFGLFHGLCFLPVVLSLVGPPPYHRRQTEQSRVPEKEPQEEEMLTEHLTSV